MEDKILIGITLGLMLALQGLHTIWIYTIHVKSKEFIDKEKINVELNK